MDRTYWLRQAKDKALFPDLLWSRPENRLHAGKLLVLGGNLHGFSAAASAYTDAERAGIGTGRVILPDALYKTVSKLFPAAEYATSTKPSGAFSQAALGEWLVHSAWADGVLIAGDLGRNSETAILLESYLQKYQGKLTLANDAVDYCLEGSPKCLDRPDTLLVLSFTQLQKLAIQAKYTTAFTSDMALLQLVEALHDFTQQHSAHLLVLHDGAAVVASNGTVTSTPINGVSATQTAAFASVWWLQNPSKVIGALTTSLLEIQK